ncbi:MAG: Fic family protein [Sphaerochaetaceae bacterium]
MGDVYLLDDIDNIRLEHRLEGCILEEEDSLSLTRILEGRISADEVIQSNIEKLHLDTGYVPHGDEEGFYPGTFCLVNFFSLRQQAVLKEVASRFANFRMAEILGEKNQPPFEFSTLEDINGQLLGDVFPAAGMLRRNESLSGNSVFCKPQYILASGEAIIKELQAEHYLIGLAGEAYIARLAYFIGEMQALHPFVAGNGRTLRLFFQRIARYEGYVVNWSLVGSEQLLEAVDSAMEGEYQLLIKVLERMVRKS